MNKDNNAIEIFNFKGSGKMTVLVVVGTVMVLAKQEIFIGYYILGFASFLLGISYIVDIVKKIKEIKAGA